MKSLLTGLLGVVIGAVGAWYVHEQADPITINTVELATEVNAQSPGYLVVLGDVYDDEAFGRDYVGKLGPIYEKYNGKYLAAGRNYEIMEGEGAFQAFVISKWPTMDAARAFWNSEEYAPLKQARMDNNWGAFDVYLLEGLPAPSATSPAAK